MKIVIVDDDRLAAMSLKTIIEAEGIAVIASGHSAQDAVKLYAAAQPDILLMDIRMEGQSGLDAAQTVLQRYPRAKILFLTTFLDDEYIVRALRMGAMGYLLKQDFQSIVPALFAVHSGQAVFGEGIVAKLPQLLRRTDEKKLADFDLTPKEIEITALIASGLSNREIAQTLYLSEGRVRNAVSAILEKLSLRDRTQLAIFYLQVEKP